MSCGSLYVFACNDLINSSVAVKSFSPRSLRMSDAD